MTRKKIKLILFLIIILAIGGTGSYLKLHNDKSPLPATNPSVASPSVQTDQPQATPQTSFDKTRFSLNDPASIWVIVNKQRPLLSSFTPSNLTAIGGASLRTEAADSTKQLMDGAKKDQISFKVISGYRSYASQKSVYDGYVSKDGQTNADTYSARPGHSEHQTGLAADLGNSSGSCDLDTCFATTAGGKWLAAHAHEYGFVIRYTENKTTVTGYQYEPWHIRYVGKDLAAELYAKKQTMEEYFELPAAPGY